MLTGSSFRRWFKGEAIVNIEMNYFWPASHWQSSGWRYRIHSECRNRRQPGPVKPWSPGNRLQMQAEHMAAALTRSHKMVHNMYGSKGKKTLKGKRLPARRPRPPFPRPASSSMSSSSSMSRPTWRKQTFSPVDFWMKRWSSNDSKKTWRLPLTWYMASSQAFSRARFTMVFWRARPM